jgi:hypothetical protein
MAKIIIHGPGFTLEEIERERLLRNLERTPEERIHLMFEMISFAMKVRKGPLKLPEGKGIVLRSKRFHEHS